ncbi:MAG: 3-deoxy-D-manno-octulosonic acid transferase [Bacteroidales bacterium]|nr:3-deoxy-D-manno-octulosonic acid transferase [Bacteroidales bacterium]
MRTIISILYLIGMWVYTFGVKVASLFNEKARQLTKGRKETWEKLSQYDNSEKSIWIHAASLGEFEQGRPIIEAIKAKYPNKKIVLTFYSPSGYEVRKNYNLADLICYLPADGPKNACHFIKAINPEMVFFVKYEFWHFYLEALKKRDIPVYGVSMIFRKQQAFFKWYGGWFRDMLQVFKHLYIQDLNSADLLDTIRVKNYTVAGDTRFDRVRKIAEASADVDLAARFVKGAKTVMVAGSSWEPDENIYLPYFNNQANDKGNDLKLIIATHEVGKERVEKLQKQISVPSFFYTNPPSDPENYKVMIVNTIGLLSAIYKYGNVAYIGGGFGVGIHNTLEAATYGMPVLFGPNHKRFKEAIDLIECGGGYCVTCEADFVKIFETFRNDEEKLKEANEASDKYVKGMCGATDCIMRDLF